MLQSIGEGYGLSPANNNYYPDSLANVEQWHNPQYSHSSVVFRGGQQHQHSLTPVPRDPFFKISANSSMESTDERQDRYAGIEQHGVNRRDDRYSGPPHPSVGGMAVHQSAMGGYGSANITYSNRMKGQVYQGMVGNGNTGGNVGETVWNKNAGHQMMMAQQSSLPAPRLMSEDPNLTLKYYDAHHKKLQEKQIQEQHHQLAKPYPNSAVTYNNWNNEAKHQEMMAPSASFDLMMGEIGSPCNQVHH